MKAVKYYSGIHDNLITAKVSDALVSGESKLTIPAKEGEKAKEIGTVNLSVLVDNDLQFVRRTQIPHLNDAIGDHSFFYEEDEEREAQRHIEEIEKGK